MAKSEQKKTQALTALLESSTLSEAAAKANISRQTLYSYIREDSSFAKAYQTAQEQLVLDQLETLTTIREKAIRTIEEIMKDKDQPASIRLKAATNLFSIVETQQEHANGINTANVNRDFLEQMFK